MQSRNEYCTQDSWNNSYYWGIELVTLTINS